ncbi:MAG: fucose isomerase [Spirochaetes bacterium]|nr:fucose isomerase [Spirochaetota bacterium]
MKEITLGVVCVARKTFDYNAAGEIFARIQSQLKNVKAVQWHCYGDLVFELEDAHKAISFLKKKDLDALVCISGTFHLGHLVLELVKHFPVPVMLWGLPELPYDGGKIRLNSICGVNLDASNLYKAGIRNYYAHFGNAIDTDWVGAIRILSMLKNAKIGLAGYHAHGFFNIDTWQPALYHQFGAMVDHFELAQLYNHPVNKQYADEYREIIESNFDTGEINSIQKQKVIELSSRLKSFIEDNNLTALAIRCWPEFAAQFGIAPCAAMSLVQAHDLIIACEGDVDGAISMLAHKAIGAQTPFLFDFSQVNLDENFALLWHCGVAPFVLKDTANQASLDTYFAAGKGVTTGFVLKPGDVSICRFDFDGSNYRLLLLKAHGVTMDKLLKGTFLKVTFDMPVRKVLDTIIYNGIAHHASMVYGDYIKPLEIAARIKGWEIVTC